MSFLAPLFLLGTLAVAAPILFHLIRRSARDRARFSSLMFLMATPPRATRRRKIEHLALLILRCLCLLALAGAFARPFFSRDIAPPDASGLRRQLVILIDTSASMRRAGLWNQARALASGYLEKTAPGDEVALMTFDRQTRTVVSMAEWTSWPAEQRAALAQERLAVLAPGWMGTQLGPALIEAAGQFESHFSGRQAAARRNIVLISDMQDGAKLDGLQGHEWPAGARVTVERVAETEQSNAGLEIPEQSAGTARVANSKDSKKEKFRLAWRGVGDSTEIYLPPGQTRTFPTPKLPPGTTTAALQLSGDDADFDNTSYFAGPETQDISICYLGMGAADDPASLLYYLQRVFPATPRRRVTVTHFDLLDKAGFAVVSGALADAETDALRGWMAGGKTALLVLEGVETGPTLARLLGQPGVEITEAAGEYALLGQIEFKHPIFAPFDDPRYSDFTPIHFWKHRRWEIPASLAANVLAKFDDGSPALTQLAVGKGNLLVLGSGWGPSDSQLAVSSKFPPLMETMLDWSGTGAPARFQFRTGDAIPSPHFSGDAAQWTKPDGKQKTMAADAAFSETDQPGIYIAAGGGRTRRFAVNLPLEESRVAPLSQDELARLGVPLGPAADEPTAAARIHQQKLRRAELENSQKLWRWLIVAALGIAGAEIILAGTLARGGRTAGAGATS